MNRKRVLRRSLAALFVLGIAMVAAAPSLCSMAPIRERLLAVFFPNLRGTARSGGAELGWFSPVVCRDLEVFGDDGRRALAVGQLQGDRPLWRLVAEPTSIGSFRTTGTRVELIVTDQGVNLARLLDPTGGRRNVSVGLEVVDGVFSYQGRGADRAWELAPVNLAVEIVAARPAEGRATELVVKPGHLFDHAALTPAMSADLLQYVLPVLAESSTVSGQFSLDLDEWHIPLERIKDATGSGRLVLHRVDIAPGALAATLTDMLGLPPGLRLAEESVVPFRMVDGRFYHRDLKFSLPNLSVCTHGSVGLDQSLDLTAQIVFGGKILGSQSPLANRPIAVSVRGTLSRPQIDFSSLVGASPLLLDSLQTLLKTRRAARAESGVAPSGTDDSKTSDPLDRWPVLERLLRGRRER